MIRSSPLVIYLNQIGGIKVSPDKHKEQEEKSTQGTEKEGTQDTESVQPNKEVTEKGEEIKDDFIDVLDIPTTQLRRNLDVSDFLTVSLDSDLKLSFVLGRDFANNFYIELSDYASGIVGLP